MSTPAGDGAGAAHPTWTERTRDYVVRDWPPERLLPTSEPRYVSSWLYVFGSLALAAFASLVVTGTLLAFKGTAWWHGSGVGRFLNDMHFWSVQILFFAIFIHIGGVFFMAAWRNGRRVTWLSGALLFFLLVTTGLTGYVITTSWEGQWIGLSAKDMLNALGIGGLFNLLNLGQFTSIHVLVMPLIAAILIGWHVLLVRRHGVVEPYARAEALTRASKTQADGDGAPQTPSETLR